jgi:dephospho-CoA kinase
LDHKEFPIVIYEAAILFESGNYKDFIIITTAPLESRIQRVIERDKTTREQVLGRINSQWTDEQRVSKSDFVIENIDVEIARRKTDEILKILKIKQNEC